MAVRRWTGGAARSGAGHQRRPRIDVYLNNWLTLRNQSETKANNEFATFNDYVDAAEKNGENRSGHCCRHRQTGRDLQPNRPAEPA